MKKRIISVILIVFLASGVVYNSALTRSEQHISSADTSEGLAYLDSLVSYPLEKAQQKVDEAERLRNEYILAEIAQKVLQKEVEKSIKQIEKGKKTYKKVFKNVCFVGDSLMAGLDAYNILSSKKIIAKVSANLSHLEENMDNILEKNPKVLILHYGINMIGTEDIHLTSFITKYSSLIKELEQKMPETRIIVSLLFPVDRQKATAKRFANVGKYNKELKKMCKTLGVEYLDSSAVLKKHTECYGVDGIHLSKAFYDKYWLKFIMREKGIY